ncbi:MAG TPA: MFS transporter [Candidatus Nitrosotalea sp.]|nr:MFS transporter [Candidatus Nitrosotalea sp.]
MRQVKEEICACIFDTREIVPRGNIAILIIATSISGASNVALAFLPVYFTSLGGTVLQYGVITTFATLIGIPSTIVGGALTGRYSVKMIAILTSWIGPSVLIGYYISNSWTALSIPILIGASGSLGSIAWRQLVADATVQKFRTAQLSVYQTLTAVPSMLAPLVGGYLIHTLGIADGFRAGIVLALALSPLSTILLVKFLREHDLKLTGKDKQASTPRAPPGVVMHSKGFWLNLTSLPKALVPLLSAYVLVIFANSVMNPYLIFYSTEVARLDTFQWGIILSLQIVLANLIRTPLGIISDRFDKRKVLFASVITTAPLSTFLVFEHSFFSTLAILLAMVVTGINYTPTHEALQIEITPREKRPALFAVYDVLKSLATSAGTMIGAVFFTLNYTMPFLSFTAIETCAGAIIGLAFFVKPGRQSSLTVPMQ